jgi:hypothetical protein
MDNIDLKGNKYFLISDYGNLCIPAGLAAKIAEECIIVTTTWKDGEEIVDKVKPITSLKVVDVDDIKAAIVQQKLENS